MAGNLARHYILNPEDLKEIIHQRIKWFLGSCPESLKKTGRRGQAPFLVGDPYYAELIPNGNYLVTDMTGHQVIEVTPKYDIVWEFGEFGVSGSDHSHLNEPARAVYNPDVKRVLIADQRNSRILEVDYETRIVLNFLSNTDAGPIGRVLSAEYGRDGIIIPYLEHHYVAEVDWNGHILWSFGTYDSPGIDLAHVQNPLSADYSFRFDWFFIGDSANNRVLAVQRDGTVWGWYPCLEPYQVKVGDLVDHVGIASLHDVGYLCEPLGNIIFFSPTRTECMVLTKDWTVLTGWEMGIFEYDLRSKPWRKPNSHSRKLTVGAGLESRIYPIHAMLSDVSITALSTQASTLKIWVPNYKPHPDNAYSASCVLDPSLPWLLYDTQSLATNTPSTYTPACREPFLGVSFLMGGVPGDAHFMFHEEPR